MLLPHLYDLVIDLLEVLVEHVESRTDGVEKRTAKGFLDIAPYIGDLIELAYIGIGYSLRYTAIGTFYGLEYEALGFEQLVLLGELYDLFFLCFS